MSDNGLNKKVLAVGAVVGVLLVVTRLLGGDGEEEAEGIDRIDTGNERNEEPVDTGLDRVNTSDDEGNEDDESEDDATVPVAAEGRFDHLDLFDYVAILAAAVKAAKSEYESRTRS
jgi:hypothetical protein